MSNERYVIHVTKQCNMKCVYCVSGDTKILMFDNTERNIRDVARLDQVRGVLFNDLSSSVTNVEQLHKRTAKTIKIYLNNGKMLNITGNHRILNEDNEWVEASKYNIHDKVMIYDKFGNNFESVEIIDIEPMDISVNVYNIGTGTRNYIANGVVVHNCYEKDKTSEYNWDEVKSFIDAIVENSPDKVFGIEFLGGEPMIGFEYIKKSVEYLENTDGVTVTNYGITTNGTIVHDELIDLMKKHDKVSWAASMDGNVFMNQMRIMKDTGENSHDIVIDNHKKLTDIFGTGRISIHMVTHPYNIAYLRQGIHHLYDNGVRSIGVGTIENTMTIGKEYCDCYIRELDLVSQDIVDGKLQGLHIDVLDSMKPRSDKRHYIKDPKTGKTIAESYGRAGDDVTKKADTEKYNVISPGSPLGTLIEDIREIVYRNHQQRLNK